MVRWTALGFVTALGLGLAGAAGAQQTPSAHLFPRWERSGRDFRPDGVWRVRARRVAARRAALLRQHDAVQLNAALRGQALGPAAAAVTGVLRTPTILFSFQNSVNPTPFSIAAYDTALFGSSPPPGRPYTLRTFYEEMSNGLFSIQGRPLGWVVLPQAEASYTGVPGTCPGNPTGNNNCNGIWDGTSYSALLQGLRAAIAAVDGSVDFGQFDNDGPDGNPNSGDDDGVVDAVVFLHSEQDGACGGAGNNHPWAHRAQLSYSTADPSANGGNIQIRDYVLQSAVGGGTSCDASQIMAIGTAAHELGHGLGLPDLYDTGFQSEGIGEWGLMGSGNYTSPFSPSRMEAWSLGELGWINLVPITAGGSYGLGPVPTADTAFALIPLPANPRNELFLVENRQAVLADSAMIRIHCAHSGSPPGCGGGLLIWHVDGSKILTGSPLNSVNSGTIHGLDLLQADNLDQLRAGSNRGDAGDPYPGVTGNTMLSPLSSPAPRLNNFTNGDGADAGFAIQAITQTSPSGPMTFQLLPVSTYRVQGDDPRTRIKVDGAVYASFQAPFIAGTIHQLSADSVQVATDGRVRFGFSAWSDGGLLTHEITASAAGDTITATFSKEFLLAATATPGGTIAATPSLNLSGTFVAQNSPVQLVAVPDTGRTFGGWSGDTVTPNATILLPMGRPYSVSAIFASPLAISSASGRPNGLMGAAYADTLRAQGGTGTFVWAATGGQLPAGVTLAPSGALSGYPTETGVFQYAATVTSGSLTQSSNFALSVTAPTLATAAVVDQLVAGTGVLTPDELRYLDLLGNRNSGYDIGDFLAWVRATGAPDALARLTGQRLTHDLLVEKRRAQ